MKNQRKEITLNNLYISELCIIYSILSYDEKFVTPKEIVNANPRAKSGTKSGKGLSTLGYLIKQEKPLVIKGDKISAREGYLWSFNDVDWDREKAKKIIDKKIKFYIDIGYLEKI